MQPVITIQNLRVGYSGKDREKPLEVLKGFSTEVNSGDFIALIGRNGSGKSTLLRSLARQQHVLEGTLLLNKKPYQNISRHEFSRLVSFVSTENLHVPHMTVYELVSLGRFPYTNWFGKLTAEDHHLVQKAIHNVGISHLGHRPINKISDGEKQRAVIARTLAQDTDIMILDEPTAFLDLPNRYEIYQLLHQLSRNTGKAVILSTHDLNMALFEADKLWILNQHNIVEGAPEDLVLKGEIDDLIENSQLHFDKKTGNFRMKKTLTGKLNLVGKGIIYHWTAKALERIGFYIDPSSNQTITALKENDIYKWIYKDNVQEIDFYSIYDLSLYLNNIKPFRP
ncbi:MAG: ABC transporter ATP-binding protein [Bacteroidota bacterium]